MFKNFSKEDYDKLLNYFNECEYGLCDYSLSSIIAWNGCIYKQAYKISDENMLIIREYRSDGTARSMRMPIKAGGETITPGNLAAIMFANGETNVSRVPEKWLQEFPEESAKFFDIKEEEGFSDYIYNTKDLAELAGHKYSKKRNLISQFKKNIAALHNIAVEDINSINAPECLELLNRMPEEDDTGYNRELLCCERNAISTALDNFKELEMTGILVKIDERTEGFAIGSRLNKNMFALNFEKANAKFKGLYQFLDEAIAKKIEGKFQYINKENDLGKPGLRQAKESYHPLMKIKSFNLKLKNKS